MGRRSALSLAAALAGSGLLIAGTPARAASADEGPSFSCRYARSTAEKLVCGDPDLAALDRQLANTYSNMAGQPINRVRLKAGQARWMRQVRDACNDAACVRRAYRSRNAELLDQSRRAASPAAYDETQPFPAPAPLLSQARAVIGRLCDAASQIPATGFRPTPGALPVITRNAVVRVAEKDGVRFAFLMATRNDDPGTCKVADVAVMPPASAGNSFLECTLDDPQSLGLGVRKTGRRTPVGFWRIDAEAGRLDRQPLAVLGAQTSIRCTQPEGGE
jgi:uncharacterized protein